MSDEQKNPSPIGDKVDPNKKPEAVEAPEVRPQTLPEVKKRAGITLRQDYYDNKFGRA